MGTRRQFLRFTSLLGMSGCFLRQPWAQTLAATATVQYSNEPLAIMPADFTGLSYEIVQLYDPKFFSAENTQLVTLCRELTPSGVLRLGGNLSDLSRWRSDTGDFDTPKQAAAIEKGKQYWEWKLTSTTARADRAGAITPEAIRNLAAFLDATNWRLLYGLNYGSGTVERAADEAACVAREVGSRLVAFQIGNESDSFGGNPLFRTRPFSFAQYWEEYQSFTGQCASAFHGHALPVQMLRAICAGFSNSLKSRPHRQAHTRLSYLPGTIMRWVRPKTQP